MLALTLGTVLAVATILIFRRLEPRHERCFYALALTVAALIYGVFALRSEGSRWLLIEVAGVVLFSAVALLGWKFSPWFLVMGWGGHVAWDLALHGGDATPFVPAWYPVACVTYDLMVALYVAIRTPAWTSQDLR